MTTPRKNPEVTREALLDAAERLFLDKGISRASLEEIARVAGLTRGALYWHFADKAEILDALVDRVGMQPAQIFAEYSAAEGQDPLPTIHRICVAALHKIAADERTRRLFAICLLCLGQVGEPDDISRHDLALRAESRRTFIPWFERAGRLGQLREGFSAESCASVLEAYLTGLLFVWLRNPEQFDMAADAPRLVQVILDGLAARGAPSMKTDALNP